MQKRDKQKKFYKKLLKIDPKVKDKFDSHDTQRSIRAYEIKYYTKISMYDWINETKSEFKENEFLKLYIHCDRESLLKKISLRTKMMIENGSYLIKTMNIQEDDQYKLQGVNTSEQLEQLTITYLEKRNIKV